jgi:uncharacterized protein (DUF488 family)
MRKLFTIGYGGRSPEEFLACLASHGVEAVVDVRLSPRGYLGAFTRAQSDGKGIQALLGRGGIRYYWWKALGNPFRNTPDWRARYQMHLDSQWEAARHLLTAVPEPYCLLCAEKLAARCHRSDIAERLAPSFSEVEHL